MAKKDCFIMQNRETKVTLNLNENIGKSGIANRNFP
jgi:hypothetical protein